MWKLFTAILSIFFDEWKSTAMMKNVYHPQDLTEHYRKEIPKIALDKIYVAAQYSDIRWAIERYKYGSDRQYTQEFVDLLSKTIEHFQFPGDVMDFAIVGVPMHWSRYTIRGFNHIERLASQLSKQTKYSIQKPLRATFSYRQSQLSKKERMKNRENTMRLFPSKVMPKYIILIDDVISTGSTANACAKILKAWGTELVYWVFIASNQ